MSDAALIENSQSLPNLSCSSRAVKSSLSPSLPPSPGHSSRKSSSCTSSTTSEVETGFAEDKRYSFFWIEVSGTIRFVFEFLGLSGVLRRTIFSLYANNNGQHHLGDKQNKQTLFLPKRLLFFFLWSLGCISLSLVSGLFALLRRMLRSQIYTAVLWLGIASPAQQASRIQKDDTFSTSTSVLQDRLEVANLAVKHLKGEGLALQEKLKEAGTRIARLEASQVDHAAYHALQAKYGQVSAEIARLAKENEELKTKLTQLGKENAELRQCLAIKEPDDEEETNRLGMLARLQNQQLDSCIFSKVDELAKDAEGKLVDVSDDSIVIISNTESPRRDFEGSNRTPLNTVSLPSSAIFAPRLSQVTFFSPYPVQPPIVSEIGSLPSAVSSDRNANPIPVFVTKRPSLPPKASKLKPLLLATRNGARYAGLRRNSLRQQVKNNFHKALGKQNECITSNDPSNTRTLNPLAPAFTPRNTTMTVTPATVPGADNNKEIEAKSIPVTSSASKAPSPSSSPFIITSPSPNSPFLRPPPPRRQSEDAPFPTLTTTPPTPTTPIPTSTTRPNSGSGSGSDSGSGSGVGTGFNATHKGTPRSTRASSVKLIRARAALRNSQRVASGSSAIMPGSPAGFKDMNTHMNTRACSLGRAAEFKAPSQVAQANATKARLIGKGMPPARRALGEVTNAGAVDAEIPTGRWTSV